MKYLILGISLIIVNSIFSALSPRAKNILDMQLRGAVERDSAEEIIELLKKGAGLNVSFYDYWEYPILIALKKREIAIVKLLIENGASLNIYTGKQKFNLLHFMARETGCLDYKPIPDLKEKMSLLIAAGLDVNAQTTAGNTPLHVAMFHGGDPVVVEELLKAEPNFEIKNKENLNVLDAANQKYVRIYRDDPAPAEKILNRDQYNFAKKILLLKDEITKRQLSGKEVVKEIIELNLPLEVAEIIESYLVTQSKETIKARRAVNII